MSSLTKINFKHNYIHNMQQQKHASSNLDVKWKKAWKRNITQLKISVGV